MSVDFLLKKKEIIYRALLIHFLCYYSLTMTINFNSVDISYSETYANKYYNIRYDNKDTYEIEKTTCKTYDFIDDENGNAIITWNENIFPNVDHLNVYTITLYQYNDSFCTVPLKPISYCTNTINYDTNYQDTLNLCGIISYSVHYPVHFYMDNYKECPEIEDTEENTTADIIIDIAIRVLPTVVVIIFVMILRKKKKNSTQLTVRI